MQGEREGEGEGWPCSGGQTAGGRSPQHCPGPSEPTQPDLPPRRPLMSRLMGLDTGSRVRKGANLSGRTHPIEEEKPRERGAFWKMTTEDSEPALGATPHLRGQGGGLGKHRAENRDPTAAGGTPVSAPPAPRRSPKSRPSPSSRVEPKMPACLGLGKGSPVTQSPWAALPTGSAPSTGSAEKPVGRGRART